MKIKRITRGNSPRWPERLMDVYRRVVRKKRTRVLLILSALLLGLAGSCVMLIRLTESILCSPGFLNVEVHPPGPYDGVHYDINYLDQSLEWTPDGSHIVFNTRGNYLTDSGVSSLPNIRTHVASADGSSLVSVANNGDFDITWFVDGFYRRVSHRILDLQVCGRRYPIQGHIRALFRDRDFRIGWIQPSSPY